MKRSRRWVLGAGAGLALGGGWLAARAWPDEGVFNPCEPPGGPEVLQRPLVRDALAGLDFSRLWDVHAHLLPLAGVPHLHAGWALAEPDGEGPWPTLVRRLQARLLAGSACAERDAGGPALAYLRPLVARLAMMPAGCKLVLLAMDAVHDDQGRPQPQRTHFQVPNALCEEAARAFPDRLEWAASIHPYRADASQAVARAASAGARAVKWIPAAQHIDPASARCEAFYRALAETGLPLITHGGDERATPGDDALGNPLRLRRALDAGVRVVVAHCATMGEGADIDQGPNGPARTNYALFVRLMDEPRHVGRLFGDLSALGQRARSGPVLADVVRRGAADGPWAQRLLYGSDYPIPAVMPLYSVRELSAQGLIAPPQIDELRRLRRHNAWLFDLVLKRCLRADGRALAEAAFATRERLRGTA